MLSTILNLFGRSPFAPLQSHMQQVGTCVHLLPELFRYLEEGNSAALEEVAAKISYQEHQADLIKNDIRNHLPKGLFLPIAREHLLEILAIQDRIADTVEDVAVLATLKKIPLLNEFRKEFDLFVIKNIDAFDSAERIINEMNELLESSFGGIEAQKVRSMVEDVAFKEHEVDLIQRKLFRGLLEAEGKMSYSTFDLWQKIFEATAAVSNLSENLANRVRMTLELK